MLMIQPVDADDSAFYVLQFTCMMGIKNQLFVIAHSWKKASIIK